MKKIFLLWLACSFSLTCAAHELHPGMKERKRWHLLHYKLEETRTGKPGEFFSLLLKYDDEMIKLALTGYPPVLDYFFFLASIADAGLVETVGCLLDAVYIQRPDLYKKGVKEIPPEYLKSIELVRSTCHGEPELD